MTTAARARPVARDPGNGPASGQPEYLEGVTPTRQARSGATFQALLQAGRDALENGGLDAMTIGDIARAANTSVGAFYGRFENKEAFFSAIQQMTIAEVWDRMRKMMDALDAADAGVVEFLEAVAKFWVALFRDNRGLYVAAFRHASTQPGVWTPFRRLGWSGSGLIAEKVLPRLARMDKKTDERQVRLAMQFVNGLLVNATINDPGPIKLDDPDMEEHVARFLCAFLGVDRAPTVHRVRSRSSKRPA